MSNEQLARMPLRCLSIRQPFAWAVCAGIKTVENRSWQTDHRGLIAIHASATKQRVTQLLRENKGTKLTQGFFTYSAIIGVAELLDVVDMNSDLESNPFAAGEKCWILNNSRLLPNPIPIKGRLRLYSLSLEDTERVMSQLPSAHPELQSGDVRGWSELLQTANPAIHRSRANSYINLARGEDAIRNLDLAIEAEPQEEGLHFNRAVVWTMLMENPQKGVEDCTRALAIEPEYVGALMLRADSYRDLGDSERAAADEQQAERYEPGSVSRWREEIDEAVEENEEE